MNIAHKLSGLAVRTLPKERLLALRARYFAVRRKLGVVERLIFGTFDTAELRRHLEERIGTEYEILMVHSSMNRLQSTYTGNPLELVRMLIELVGPTRTLAMPAFYFGDPAVGSVHETFRRDPRFHLRRAASQMGLATELFRRTKGVRQSRHPVYRVAAFGPHAEEMTRGHELAHAPAGHGTPFEYMAAHDTMVIGIGKSFDVMTQVHHVESVMGDEFPVPRSPVDGSSFTDVTVLDGGEEIPVRLPGSGGIAWRFNIAKLPDILDDGLLQRWRFHNVPMFSARAGPVVQSLVEAARRGETLYDPP